MKKIKMLLILLVVILFNPNVKAYTVDCSKTLKQGSTGREVSILQMELNKKALCGIDIDGSFGPKTTECVKKYQRRYNLTVDGIVGPETCKSINATQKTSTNCSIGGQVSTNTNVNTNTNTNNNTNVNVNTNTNTTQVVSPSKKYVVTSKTGLNLREKATKQSKSLAVAPYNAVITVTDTSSEWYKVSYNGMTGYMHSNYLALQTTSPISSNDYMVLGSTVNVRKGPSTSYAQVTQVTRGTKVKVTGTSGDWYKVTVNSAVGYIRKDLLTQSVIIVDLSDQRLYFFKGNQTILTASVVTGMKNKHDTPTGKFQFNTSSKETNRYLDGYNDDGSKYHSYVNYWMPFNGGVGFHDATWRAESQIDTVSTYETAGSHGCVNMKYNDAKTLYTNITENTLVIVQQ